MDKSKSLELLDFLIRKTSLMTKEEVIKRKELKGINHQIYREALLNMDIVIREPKNSTHSHHSSLSKKIEISFSVKKECTNAPFFSGIPNKIPSKITLA